MFVDYVKNFVMYLYKFMWVLYFCLFYMDDLKLIFLYILFGCRNIKIVLIKREEEILEFKCRLRV